MLSDCCMFKIMSFLIIFFFFFKQKTAYEMRISDWSSDVCSSDLFISLHTPLTDATRNLIDGKAIAKMRKGVRIVNCARGGIVDEEALKAARESGNVAGAALDVFAEEPAKANPLFGLPNPVAQPHPVAAATEAQTNEARHAP